MAETLATFQSQLSGVMETVFKAAMYEITRLVEDSFLEEMNRCRDQVESLKKRLKWSESKRKEGGDGRGRCKDCGKRGESGEEETGESLRFISSVCLSVCQSNYLCGKMKQCDYLSCMNYCIDVSRLCSCSFFTDFFYSLLLQ